MAYLFIALAFTAGFLIVFGINLLLVEVLESQRKQVRERFDEERKLLLREQTRHSLEHKDLYQLAAEEFAELPATPLRKRFTQLMEQSGLRIHPTHLMALSIVAGLIGCALTGVFSGSWILAAVVAPIVGVVPILYATFVRARRLDKLQSQLPDAFDLMSRTVRAGQTISQALQAVADEFGPPISEEFGLCYDQQNLGMTPEAAMRDLAQRTGLLEVKIFVLAVMVHRQTGGNLSELLEKLSAVIRDRYRIHGMIKTLTAEGRLQALILLALPPFMFLVLLTLNRDYAMMLFQYSVVPIGTLLSMLIGALWMYHIINFDF